MKLPIVVLLVLGCVGCDLTITTPTPITTTATTPAVTVTNTNTNTATVDRSDTQPTTTPSPSGGNGSAGPLPLPTYGEQVTKDIATNNPALLANSCQETSGETAWQFLDLVIRTLRATDQRWGYLCKDQSCVTFARDIVAYKASATDTGIWIVDVIGNHCPGPSDPPPAVRWGVLPFETTRRWAANRLTGIF